MFPIPAVRAIQPVDQQPPQPAGRPPLPPMRAAAGQLGQGFLAVRGNLAQRRGIAALRVQVDERDRPLVQIPVEPQSPPSGRSTATVIQGFNSPPSVSRPR